MKYKNEIRIMFDEDMVEAFRKEYFKRYPNRRKFPIHDGRHPSINKWSILPRMSCNQLKQHWKEFTIFVVERHGYHNLMLKKCSVDMILHNPTKRRCDSDNYTPKMIFDGFTEANLWVDDSFEVVESLLTRSVYDKGNPATEFIIKY